MQEAGYILLMPGGDWNADTTYHILHLVNHNGASWLCKVEECTGQEPSDSNTEYWQRFGTAVDLANYLSKSGGEVSGALTLNGGTSSADLIMMRIMTNGKSSRMGAWMDDKTPMYRIRVINVDDGTYSTFDISEDSLLFTPKGATEAKTVFHTGNKPTGTYTGNGDATERIINIGSGNICYIREANAANNDAIVTRYGAYVRHGNTLSALTRPTVTFYNGILTLKTADLSLNNDGWTYEYEVL